MNSKPSKNRIVRLSWLALSAFVIIPAFIFLNWLGTKALDTASEWISSRVQPPGIPHSNPNDAYWANRIVEGGLILYFRHAEREKWGTVTVFDWLEATHDIEPRGTNWERSVCLTVKGAEEAKLVGLVFEELGLEVGRVISSPSCRARETASLAFGGFYLESQSLLHATALTPKQQAINASLLKDLLVSNAPHPGELVVVSGHGETLGPYRDLIFASRSIYDFEIDELGFYVIEIDAGGSPHLRHKFQYFSTFAHQLLDY